MSSTTDILSNIYDVKSEHDDRFLIKNHVSARAKVVYLDEPESDSNEPNQTTFSSSYSSYTPSLQLSGGNSRFGSLNSYNSYNFNSFNSFGSFGSSSKASNDKTLYPSMADMNDSDVQEFLQVCHLGYIATNHKSNSIFIVPDSTAMKAIKADIKSNLGSTKPDSPEGVAAIKSMDLIYKAFILDSFGKVEKNASFEYRLPVDYPANFNPDVIYRRTSRYKDKAFFIKLDKKGMKVSTKSDMSDAVTCTFIDRVGKLPNYVSFVFKGNVLSLLEQKLKGGKARRRKARAKKLFNSLMKENEDYEEAAMIFTASMINKYGVEKCKPYYGANLLQTSFALISAFGNGEVEECDNCGAIHAAMLKAYKPENYRALTNANIRNVIKYGENFISNLDSAMFNEKNGINGMNRSIDNSKYLRQIKNGYSKISGSSNNAFIDNEIAADIAYGIYDETSNSDLAVSAISKIKRALGGEQISSFELRNYVAYLNVAPFKGLQSRSDFPMIATGAAVSSSSMSSITNFGDRYNGMGGMNGGNPGMRGMYGIDDEDTLQLEFGELGDASGDNGKDTKAGEGMSEPRSPEDIEKSDSKDDSENSENSNDKNDENENTSEE